MLLRAKKKFLLASSAGFLGGGAQALIARGMGQGMRSNIGGQISGGWSMTYRSKHRTPTKISRFRVVIPTFFVSGATDTDLANNFNFQVGLEYPYTLAFTGCAPRTAATKGGSNILSYLAASGPRGYILTDWVTLPTPVPAGGTFGLWTTVEQPQGTNGVLPYTDFGSNFVQKYEMADFNVTSNISANLALTSTGLATQISTAQAGDATWMQFTPAFLIVDYNASDKLPAIWGDSIADGVGEFAAGSGTQGTNTQGSQYSNSGFAARGINEKLGLGYVKIALPGDSFGNVATPANVKYRMQLLALANPTHLFSVLGTNDLEAGLDGPTIAPNAKTFYTAVRANNPGIRIVQACILPRSTGTWTAANGTGQTADPGFGTSVSNRGVVNNTYIRALSASWGHDISYDPNPTAENGYTAGNTATETSKWKATGVANYATGDGIHPNSNMHALIAAAMTNPFT